MTDIQRIEIRRSEIRERLGAIMGLEGDDYTEAIQQEEKGLQQEIGTLEQRHRSALLVSPDPSPAHEPGSVDMDSEAAEVRKLRGKVKLAAYVGAALGQRPVDGPEAEYNAALEIAPGHFPLELLAPEADALETRATTNADSAHTQRPWLDRLFADTAAMRLGLSFQSVPAGVASHPVTTAGASAAQRGRSEAAADAAWTVSVTDLKPSRNTVRAVFSEEDALRLPTLEAALRRDLGMAVAEGVDRAIFKGDANANENAGDITGLQTLADLTEQTVTQTNKVKGPETLEAFTALVDGLHAGSLGDLRVVAAVGAWRLWENTVINSAADNTTLAAFLRAAGLSWTSRGELETATTNGKFAAFIGRGRGLAGAGVAAMWGMGSMIRDPYSGAAKGEVALTLSYFWNLGFPRPANFARLKFVT